MADISLTQGDGAEESDEGRFFSCRTGVFEQGDGPGGSHADDEALPPLLRIQKYVQSDNVQDRQMVWRILMDLFRSTPANTMTTYLPMIMNVVSKLANETDNSLRTDLLEQIPNLAVVARDCISWLPTLKYIVSEHLLPMVVRNLRAHDNLVRKTAQSALFSLLEHGLVSRHEAEIQVCPTVHALLTEDSATEYHFGAVTLMSKMAPLLGREITERVFLYRFSELCTNKTFYVRKDCASHFGDFCAVVGKDAYEQVLLPCYIALCDDSVWGVRKACAEVAMSMSCACPPAPRRSALAPVFVKLLQDPSRWVRMSAFQTLGPFISTFADPAITSVFYNNMGDLVMVNTDGREFRVNSSPTLNRPYHPLENVCKEDIPELFEKDEDNIVMNPLLSENSMDGDCHNSTMELESEKKREEVIMQKNMQVVSKAMYGEVILDANTDYATNSDDKENEGVTAATIKEDSEDIKEIVKTVKNAVLSFRNSEPVQSDFKQSEKYEYKFDVQSEPLLLEPNICDNFASGDNCSLSSLTKELGCIDLRSTETNCNDSCDNSSDSSAVMKTADGGGSGAEERAELKSPDAGSDSLEMFNSYKYWYVSPEMPLDLSIVDDGRSPKKNPTILDCQMEHLNELFSTVVFDTTQSSIDSIDLYPSVNDEQVEPKEPLPFHLQDDEQHIVPRLLIDHFVSMTDPSLARNTDNEMAYHCAYSLPAVALTLGSKNWHLLKGTVETLACNMQYKVRHTIASSLHELALILGPDISSQNLTPIFDGFFKDLDEVRIGILKHLAHFLQLISSAKRNLYLPRLAEFLKTDSDTELNWRFRQELAVQLLIAVPLFRPSDASKHIANTAQELLCDKVAAVRQTALALVTGLLRHVSADQSLTSRLLITLAERFAHSKMWRCRQTFALLCSELLVTRAIPVELFASDVMPHLLDLSWDPVANVRLVVARTISKHIITIQYFADPNNQHYDGLLTVLRRLQADRDRDVRCTAYVDNFTNPMKWK